MIKNIAVFCGAQAGKLESYREAAEQLADVLCAAGMSLVYGGANVGLMGVIADRMLQQGGKVIGVIPQSLVAVEIAHPDLTEQHVVQSMQERKTRMTELADAFIMMPGGHGSLDEFFEVVVLTQLGYHQKPCGILNIANYYDHLLKFLDHAVQQGFVRQPHRNMVIVNDTPRLLVESFMNYQAPMVGKWVKQPA